MKRHFYISNDLDDLERLERDLENRDISRPQIHILSNDDAELEKHHLNQVESLLKKDVIHSTLIGAVVGVAVAILVLGTTYILGLVEGYLWIPVIFLAIILLGFCTWEGGLIGIQEPHHEYRKFHKLLEHGKHVLIVDITPAQEETLQQVIRSHPRVKSAGLGGDIPDWVVGMQKQWYKFIRWAP
jgi:hypothetical protein